jgi:hypothetical protein
VPLLILLCAQLEDLGADVPAEDEGVDDAELLMEVMELREALDEASSSEAVDEVREQNEGEPLACATRGSADTPQQRTSSGRSSSWARPLRRSR